jgi:hypothetical protein
MGFPDRAIGSLSSLVLPRRSALFQRFRSDTLIFWFCLYTPPRRPPPKPISPTQILFSNSPSRASCDCFFLTPVQYCLLGAPRVDKSLAGHVAPTLYPFALRSTRLRTNRVRLYIPTPEWIFGALCTHIPCAPRLFFSLTLTTRMRNGIIIKALNPHLSLEISTFNGFNARDGGGFNQYHRKHAANSQLVVPEAPEISFLRRRRCS